MRKSFSLSFVSLVNLTESGHKLFKILLSGLFFLISVTASLFLSHSDTCSGFVALSEEPGAQAKNLNTPKSIITDIHPILT